MWSKFVFGLVNPRLMLGIIFSLYSLIFIERTSFITFDGSRYFCLFDDAMISLRYGWNLAHGLGAVWNPGERVEGYTNPLMVLLMALVSLLFDKHLTVLVIQLLGIIVLLAIAYVMTLMVEELPLDFTVPQRDLLKLMAVLGTLAYYPLVFWSLMGMETGLLCLTLAGSILLAFRYARLGRRRDSNLAAFLLGLSYLSRPDSALVAGLVLAFLGYAIIRQTLPLNDKIIHIVITGGVYTSIIGLHLLFRWLYYGELTPNTYTLKIGGMPLGERLRNGFGFIGLFVLESWPVMILAGLSIFMFRSLQILLLVAIFFGLIAYQVYTGGDPWIYWRILSPGMPLMWLVSSCVLLKLAAKLIQAKPDKVAEHHKERWELGLAFAGLIVVLLYSNLRFLPEISGREPVFSVAGNQINTRIGLALADITRPQATLGVITAGSIIYYADRYAFDFLGKMDKKIANLPPDLSGSVGWNGMNSVPGHNKYDLNYSIGEKKPDFVEIFQWGRQNLGELEQKYYVKVFYAGVELEVRRDSAFILWNKLR